MKSVFNLLFCLLVSINCIAQRNVILIIADDLGTDYCGFYEDHGDTINMPNVRRLLAKGVRFQNAMSNPVCSPSRAGTLTGRYSFRNGIGTSVTDSGSTSLDTSEVTIPKLLKINSPNTIATAQIGKWHLTNDTTAISLLMPNIMGYDYYSGNFKAQLYNYYYWSKITNGVSQMVSNYATTETTNDAISWIKSQNSNPFFLWLAYNAPHIPYHLPPAGLHSYTGLSGTQEDIDSNPKLYFKAMAEAMDHEIGRLFDSLQTYNKFDSTDFIFIGDNGNATMVCQSTLDSLRSKGTIYLNGNHVPVIISGPSVINPNRVSDALINTQDLFATILELAGDTAWRTQLQPGITVDSKSLIPLIKNNATAVRPWAYTEIFNGKASANNGKTIRNTDYNLLHFENGLKKFYNIKNDPHETINLLESFLTDTDVIKYNYLCSELAALTGDTSGYNAVIAVTQSLTNVFCNGAATGKIYLQVSGAVAPYTYIWNDGATIKNRTNLSAGTYTVTVTDSKFQSRKFSINITQSSKIVIKSTISLTNCGGNIISSVKGGKSPYTYLWSNNSTNASLYNVIPGAYILTVTDSKGCTMAKAVNLINSSALYLSKSQTKVYCNAYTNGTATVMASGGAPAYSYLWSNGQTNQTATGLTSTTYTVKVMDSNGCSLQGSFNIAEINPLMAAVSITGPICKSDCNASAGAAILSGGTPSLDYLWSNGLSTQAITGLCAGNYTVTIHEDSNCIATVVSTIIDPPMLLGLSNLQLSCNNQGSGTASASVSGGKPPYSYLWSNGQTTVTASGLSTGSYLVDVTDANGCSIQIAIPLTVSPPVTATKTVNNPTCNANIGVINIAASGGVAPFQYQWFTGANTSSINNLPAGTYTVLVTDNAGCSTMVSATLVATGTAPAAPTIINGPKTEVCAGAANKNYYVPSSTNVNSYLWTASTYVTISNGQGTNSVYANFDASFNTGTLSVIAINYCGSSAAKLATIRSKPPTPGTVTGPISVCANQSNVGYSIAPVKGATTYEWGFSSDTLTFLGQGNTDVNVNFTAVAGNITVRAGNACGYSTVKRRPIAIVCRTAENEFSLINELNIYPIPATDVIYIDFNSKVADACIIELKDITGRLVNSKKANTIIGNNTLLLPLKNLSNGLYFLIVEMNGIKTVRKIAIE